MNKLPISRLLEEYLSIQVQKPQQQHEQYIGPAYDPSRDLSPNLPSCDSSMGDPEQSISSGSSCSTPSNNNHQSCGSEICRPPHGSSGLSQHQTQRPLTPPDLCRPHSSFEQHIPKIEPLQSSTPPESPAASCVEENGTFCKKTSQPEKTSNSSHPIKLFTLDNL
ncbi:unnamed protein product [Diabrotica balteata]|uniref:Uncharacterized protein n=1 Tax=Diabrotica balteata TaxID=107213 RepID=A0A9N9T795_DIABA|nr:unnamed protein product [Diabrotica balteata]